MNKPILGSVSDYAKASEELKFYKRFINRKELDKIMDEKLYAEATLNMVLDLINSNEELAHFESIKKTLRKPIEDYFKKVK